MTNDLLLAIALVVVGIGIMLWDCHKELVKEKAQREARQKRYIKL